MIDNKYKKTIQLHLVQNLMKRVKGDYFEDENEIISIVTESKTEACQMIERSTGRRLGIIKGSADRCPISEYKKRMKSGEKYINLHNHPNFTAHSIDDLYILLTHKEICEIRIISVDRTYYAKYDKSIQITRDELDTLGKTVWKRITEKNLTPIEKHYKRNLLLGNIFDIIIGEVLI